MEHKKARQLIKKYLNGTCTAEEKAIIESWYLKESIERDTVESSSIDFFETEDQVWHELRTIKRRKSKIVWYGAAAAAVVAGFTFLFYLSYTKLETKDQVTVYKSDIIPGSNKAVLTLSDGSKIDLDNSNYGLLAEQAGVYIRKTEDGQLVYDLIPGASTIELEAYNTIETPKGGQYQINLPDGTKVWLNAASSLKFPALFGAKERLVEVTGEVYFEVAKYKDKPFTVKTIDQAIEVLGTHFNVNAYPEESTVRTSLLEGSVSISAFGQQVVLKPGQQGILSQGQLKVLKIGLEDDVIAWKNGYFNFNGENITTIMNKISRWYDVEIDYNKDFVDQGYVGTISRFENVSKVLRMLELTGTVHFEIKGRRIVVMP